MTNIIEKTDTDLKTDVLSALKYEPSVKVADIGVLVQDGTVTLNGYATSYMEKGEAVRAAKRVAGVKAIADDIEVKFPDSLHRIDGDIATVYAVARYRDKLTAMPWGGRFWEYSVRNGMLIPLEGEVGWEHPEGNRLYFKGRITQVDYEFAL